VYMEIVLSKTLLTYANRADEVDAFAASAFSSVKGAAQPAVRRQATNEAASRSSRGRKEKGRSVNMEQRYGSGARNRHDLR